MRIRRLLVLALLFSVPGSASALPPPATVMRVTTANRIGLTVSNFGTIGNNFMSRSPSMEYPNGSGFEHLTKGGLWIGGHAIDGVGAFTGVTTGFQDAPSGGAPPGYSEFTPLDHDFTIRNLYFSPNSRSYEDLIAFYADLPAKTTLSPEAHRPLNVRVRQETYSWNHATYRDIVFMRYIVTNYGNTLSDVWIGMWAELASGPKNEYWCWPPSSLCSNLGSWFQKKWVEYDAGLRLFREHRCSGLPVPGGCQLEVTPYWAGLQLLTPPDAGAGQAVTLAAWEYAPGDGSRNQDVERYALMSAGTIQDLSVPEFQPLTGDPVELLAIGPFGTIAPGDSVEVAFALLGGADIAEIQAHAAAAQHAYDLDFTDVVAVEAGPDEGAGLVLLGPRTNPVRRGEVTIAFMLAGPEEADLRVVDVAGRRVRAVTIPPGTSGVQQLDLDSEETLKSGVYFLRLRQGARTATARMVVVP